MATIKKKIWPKYFELVKSGKKRFDVRVADFSIEEGDTLILKEWDPQTKRYTGRTLTKKVDYLIKFDLDTFGQRDLIEKNGLYVLQLSEV